MRTWVSAAAVAVAVGWSPGEARAQVGERFVDRTPRPLFRIGRDESSRTVGRYTDPSVTVNDTGGYNGGRLPTGGLFSRGAVVYPPPNPADTVGVFGTDYVGMALSPRRVFLPATDPTRYAPLIRSYRTDVVFPEDIFALRPFRKAVIEKREDAEKRRHGEEGHGDEGHGVEVHAPEAHGGK
ncbi:MAG: hypothetical protein C0501_22670 [Isosphaera sp.]|nr:hypothetical protein [Isosphaera sp.]